MSAVSTVEIRGAETPADFEVLGALLLEYGAHLAGTLGAEDMSMTGYEQELSALRLRYELALLALVGEEAAGCVLLKPIKRVDESACELKRLWVRPQFRGLGIGRKLTERAMAEGKRRKYRVMYLDTVPSAMQTAHGLYENLGFKPAERYNDNPVRNVRFFRRVL